MALRTVLSEYAREQLVQCIATPWFQEVLEVIREVSISAEKTYSEGNRALTEMEHQALTCAYRQGIGWTPALITSLAQKPKDKPVGVGQPWGEMKKEPINPKVPTQSQPEKK